MQAAYGLEVERGAPRGEHGAGSTELGAGQKAGWQYYLIKIRA